MKKTTKKKEVLLVFRGGKDLTEEQLTAKRKKINLELKEHTVAQIFQCRVDEDIQVIYLG